MVLVLAKVEGLAVVVVVAHQVAVVLQVVLEVEVVELVLVVDLDCRPLKHHHHRQDCRRGCSASMLLEVYLDRC